MTRTALTTICSVAVLMAAMPVQAAGPADATPAVQATAPTPPSRIPLVPVTEGYLSQEALARLAAPIPAPPAPGTEADLADKAESTRYRALENTDRWQLAIAHAELRPRLALQHFDCVLGMRILDAETPRLDALAARLFHDAEDVIGRIKERAPRNRPIADDLERPACQRVPAAYRARANTSYPSGSSAVATAYAEALARLAPDKAEEIRNIGNEIGISRLVCGMHYPLDVRTGAEVGQSVATEILALPEAQADIEAARAELAAARAMNLSNPSCAAERLALSQTLPPPISTRN